MAHLSRHSVDFVFNHSLHQLPLLWSKQLHSPMLTTLHTPPFPWIELGAALAAPTARFVAVSEFVARQWSGLPRPAITIHNGIDVDAFLAGDGGEDLVWVGRITPEKGTDLAIEVARRSGRRLRIIGPVSDPHYFATEVQPHLGAGVHYLGHLTHNSAPEWWQAAQQHW